ncbi:MAG: hypothetical protein IPQ13_01455 [Holophagaceae bacterium]|nr:hypothetical protein [Holophagaceae bacterium]
MSVTTLRTSSIRAAGGGILLLAALGVAIFVLPDATRRRDEQEKARLDAKSLLAVQIQQLAERQSLVDRLTLDQKHLEELEKKMPSGNVGQLQWELSQILFEKAKEHGVRLQTVKYGLPSREGAKGTDLESIDVEFTALGIYPAMKPFMLAIEGSGLPFAVGSARLEESPEGARLSVTLRAFRHSGVTSKSDSAAPEEA